MVGISDLSWRQVSLVKVGRAYGTLDEGLLAHDKPFVAHDTLWCLLPLLQQVLRESSPVGLARDCLLLITATVLTLCHRPGLGHGVIHSGICYWYGGPILRHKHLAPSRPLCLDGAATHAQQELHGGEFPSLVLPYVVVSPSNLSLIGSAGLRPWRITSLEYGYSK